MGVFFGITFIITYALKFLFMRARPSGEMFTLGFSDYAFPSTHAALAFSLHAVIDEEFKHIMWAWVFIAIFISMSRLYFSYHHFSDVAFGALLGCTIGYFVDYYFEKRYVKKHGEHY